MHDASSGTMELGTRDNFGTRGTSSRNQVQKEKKTKSKKLKFSGAVSGVVSVVGSGVMKLEI